SIFDNELMGWLKSLHDKYGMVVSLYLFYQNSENSFNLSQMPTKFSKEFRENAYWLKLGFHALSSTSRYDGSMYTPAVAKNHYTQTINQIKRFAHAYNIDTVIRSAFYTGNLETVKEFKKLGVKGFFTADDDRTNNMYLNSTERSALVNSGELVDYKEDI